MTGSENAHSATRRCLLHCTHLRMLARRFELRLTAKSSCSCGGLCCAAEVRACFAGEAAGTPSGSNATKPVDKHSG